MEERRKELKPEKVDKPTNEIAQPKPESEENSQFVATYDPRLRIQDSERTQYVAPVSMKHIHTQAIHAAIE